MASPVRAAKYPRISDDGEGLELGVTRQNEDLDAYAKAKGYVLVGGETYGDNDIGASARSKKKRKGYDRLLADAKAGKFEVIIAYTSSRLTRRPGELEDLITLSKTYGTRFEYIRSPSFDLNTADGQLVARMLAAADAAEAERIAERVARKRQATAASGRASGGNRPFGFKTPDGPLEAAEAKLIRAAAEGILSGAHISDMVETWNASGLRTARGSEWARNSLLSVLKSPRVAGIAFYQGKPLREEDGNYKQAVWPAIIDVETWEALCAKLEGNKRGRAAWRSYLLSGTIRCSCGVKMYGGASKGGPHVYRCQKEKGGCGQRSISGTETDRLIEDWVELKLQDVGEDGELPAVDEWDGEDELREAVDSKDEIWAAYKAKVLPGSEAFPKIAEYEETITRLTRERAAAGKSQLRPSDARADWESGVDYVRRGIVKRLLVAVVIYPHPAGRRAGKKFEAFRVVPEERKAPLPAAQR